MRSIVEILSFSRLSRRPEPGKATRIRDERLVYRAVADQRTSVGEAYNEEFLPRLGHLEFEFPSRAVKAGYLGQDTDGNWYIQPAKAHLGTTFVRVNHNLLSPRRIPEDHNTTSEVWVKPAPVEPRPAAGGRIQLHYARTSEIALRTGATGPAGLVAATLVCSGEMTTRHMHTAVYEPNSKAKRVPIPKQIWEQFEEDRDMKRGIEYRELRNEGDPLFYIERADGLFFFGPTLFFRIPYPHYTADFVPKDHSDKDGALDLAESLFGTVNGEKRDGVAASGAHKGRVSFGDATLTSFPDDSPFLAGHEGIRWPDVLSSPKPTSYQNYLVQRSDDGSPGELRSYFSPTPDSGSLRATALRGFKRYWHRGSAQDALSPQEPTEHASQRTVIRPVRPGVKFAGRIRFENLTPVELGALVTAIELPGGCRHKLGMGKPLGMGTALITAQPTLFDPQGRYRNLTSTGRYPDDRARRTVADAKASFESAIEAHFSAATELNAASSLWDIPRLQALLLMLEWEDRPGRDDTAYIEELGDFRKRQVLPTPQEIKGLPDPGRPDLSRGQPVRAATQEKLMAEKRAAKEARRENLVAASTVLQAMEDAIKLPKWKEQLEAIESIGEDELSKLSDAENETARFLLNKVPKNKKSKGRIAALRELLASNTAGNEA